MDDVEFNALLHGIDNEKPCEDKRAYKGACCCNCKHRVSVKCHPWNQELGKGSIQEVLGFGCAALIKETKEVIFSDRQHGMCEMHEPK